MSTITKYASASTAGWTNPSNAYADNTSYATATPTKNGDIESDFYNFGFEIPTGATINSVTAEVEWKVSTSASIATLELQAINGYTTRGTLTNTSEPTTLTTQQLSCGTWTVSELNDNTESGGMKLRLTADRGNSKTEFTASVNYVSVTVDYTYVETVTGASELTGASGILASAKLQINGEVGIIGYGSLEVSATVIEATTGNADILGYGSVTASANLIKDIGSNIDGEGNIEVSALVLKTITGNAEIEGAGNAQASASLIKSISANICGAGQIEATLVIEQEGKAEIEGTSQVCISGIVEKIGYANIYGAGETIATATIIEAPDIITGSGNIIGTSDLESTGIIEVVAEAYITGDESVSCSGIVENIVSAEISGTSQIDAIGITEKHITASISGNGDMDASANIEINAKGNITGSSCVTCVISASASAKITGSAEISVKAKRIPSVVTAKTEKKEMKITNACKQSIKTESCKQNIETNIAEMEIITGVKDNVFSREYSEIKCNI